MDPKERPTEPLEGPCISLYPESRRQMLFQREPNISFKRDTTYSKNRSSLLEPLGSRMDPFGVGSKATDGDGTPCIPTASRADGRRGSAEMHRLRGPTQALELRGPKDCINAGISHSCSKAQYKRDARNHGL